MALRRSLGAPLAALAAGLAGLAGLAAADAPAAKTLAEMVAWIDSGKAVNNFFDGETLKKKPKADKQMVASCLLDKVGAIVQESGVEQFVNDLQVDLAACCTKGERSECFADVGKAYDLLASVSAGETQAAVAAPKVAAILLRAVEKRITAKEAKPAFAHYFGKCPDVDECTLELLKAEPSKRAEF
eukprot:CAMPEP_0183518466 /NCGR_PEP_ID=MMETSP0371-20130417/15508_1 /TAXON_ID=268820 /ORGANISM="Peridinium aciculiferum, Strain PAER-2" /LENGTH=185 /DNA_ID=CAMNT_0025716505 /DNA_START=59 /DNA_END=616 /DNA_ORIENTATION=+